MSVPRIGLLVIIALACNRPLSGARREWSDWFETTFRRMPRVDEPAISAQDYKAVRTRDGLVVHIHDDFHVRNEYGCWEKGADHWPGSGWRDVCVGRVDPELDIPGFRLKPGPRDPEMSDQHQSENGQVNAMTIGRHRAIVERARVSGGIEFAQRERRIAATIELGPGEWASLRGRTGDDAGYAELLGLISAIESR